MKGSKIFIIIMFIGTVMLGATAVFVGWRLRENQSVTPGSASAGSDPENCLNVSTANPKNDTTCASNGRTCNLRYCPSYNSPSQLDNSVQGDIVKIISNRAGDAGTRADIVVNGVTQDICNGCSEWEFTFDEPQTDLEIQVIYETNNTIKGALGWRSPKDGMCGDNNYDPFSVNDIPALDSGFTEVSVQCWADLPIGDTDFDFEDFGFRVGIKMSEETTTTTTSTTSSTTTSTTTTTLPGSTSTTTTSTTTTTLHTTTTTLAEKPLPKTGIGDGKNDELFIGLFILVVGCLSIVVFSDFKLFASKDQSKINREILKRKINRNI